ncbi:Annexin type fungal XIV [Penicillium chrysogenum]|uniref:Annexin type fungal XIV n=1 Tax=Penicillium chrysogenum TaxID=5076 RepID=A0ABQ8W612_PENCH|nr:Annexin type fungal XIV [Penicillium chrysogenum]
MPQGTGTLTSDKGRVLGQFEVEGAQYIFVGNLTSFGQSFSIPNADVTYDSADQLRKEAEEFEELPIEKDQIEIKLKNGVAITGGFDMPFSDGEVKKGTINLRTEGTHPSTASKALLQDLRPRAINSLMVPLLRRANTRLSKASTPLRRVNIPLRKANIPPPQQGHYPPPQQGQYGAPPAQGGPYGATPPQPHGYHAPPAQPPYGQQPHGYAPPGQPPAGGPGYPAPGQPPVGYGAPPPGGAFPPQGPPAQPSLGYVPGQVAPGDFRPQADALRKAMKGFGTDEKALIAVLSQLDPLQMAAVRDVYSKQLGRDLYKDVKSETGGEFRDGLLAVIEGPLMHDVESLHSAIDGVGTKEWLLNEVLLGRSNADINAIRTAYEMRHRRSLAKDVEGDLSFKTSTLFNIVLHAARHEESTPINPQTIDTDIRSLQGKNVTDVCAIFAKASNAELRAISQTFESRYHIPLEKHIEKEFSGHMEDALLLMLRSATDPAMRDAILLEESMSGMGTKDERLIVRVVRAHWDRNHKEMVKRAYKHKFGKNLIDRVRSETSSDYQRLMVALLE